MNKIIYWSLILLFGVSTVSVANDKAAYKIYDKEGNSVKYSDMIKELSKADVVFFGEQHNVTLGHWLEYEVSVDLNKINPIIIGAEMFETDNQEDMQKYMKGEIKKDTFMKKVRLWNNYSTDYAPLLEWAKENKIDYYATNIPRRYARKISRKGFPGLDSLTDEEYSWLPPLPIKFDPNLTIYKQIVESGTGHKMMNMDMSKVAKAQAIKDATMGYWISQFYEKGKIFIHLNGRYHSDWNEGIVWYLKEYSPELKIKTITSGLQKDLDVIDDDNKEVADFIIVIDDNIPLSY